MWSDEVQLCGKIENVIYAGLCVCVQPPKEMNGLFVRKPKVLGDSQIQVSRSSQYC